jgi:DNA-directed RNA polymerase subunit K/omega
MVSQRVRQLGQGHKALVPADHRMSYMDIALLEIADGKLQFEMGTAAVFGDSEPKRRKKKG